MTKKVIPSLNGLRAISILLVLGHHAAWASNFPVGLAGRWAYFFDGTLGVNIFFVISGFLITYLLIEEEGKNTRISLKKFYIRRFLRILPVYYCLLFCYFILQLAGVINLSFREEWLPSLTFTRDFFGSQWETGHLWSLAVEEQFYILWPLIFRFLPKSWRMPVAGILIVAAAVFRYIFHFNHNLRILDNHSFFTNMDCIMIGCFFALNFERACKFVSLFNASVIRIILLAVIIISVYIHLHFSNDILSKTFVSISAGLLIVSFTNITHGFGFKFLNYGFMDYAGKLSYSIYIWQQIFFSPSLKPFSSLPWNYLLIITVALISYNFLEKPILGFKSRFKT